MAQPAPKSASTAPDEVGSFGKVAIKLGFITQAQLDEAMKAQTAAAKAGLRKRIGEILIKKGYLTPEQLEKVIKGQTVARKRIGDYELLSKLGEGGMGSVFKARQVLMDRVIALKILSPKMAKNKEFRDRFLREARAVAKLNHPHIVAGIDVGSADGYCYFAMEFVDGESLGQYMHRRGGKLPEDEVLQYARQIALALGHAHQNKLLHRDVKPDNVLLEKTSKAAKLADLGLARSAESAAEDAALTQAGQAVGTPFYISPEQARGRSDLTPATDLYSLGATLFHMLTGQVPFDGPTAAVIMTRHLTDPVPSLRAIVPGISQGTERIVMKLMEKEPDDRYENCDELVEDIDRVLGGSAGSGKKEKEKEREKTKVKTTKPSSSERDEPASGGSSPTINTRVLRRRRRSNDVGLGSIMVLLLILAAVIYFVDPMNSGKNKKRPVPVPPSTTQTTQTATKTTPVAPPEPPAPPARPAVLQAGAEGGQAFKDDFESGKHEHFEVDPLVGKSSGQIRIIKDEGGNHVLKLGLIRPTNLLAKESGCMARLLLPQDVAISRNAVVSFMIHFERYADTNPEVRIWWDHKIPGEPRSVSLYKVKDATFGTSWGKVQFQLNKAEAKMPSREPADSPQFIGIYAGKPDETLDVFIDDVELIIPAEGAAPAAAPKEAAPAVPAQGEPPVAPRPAKKNGSTEAPVAPPPKKRATDPGAFGGAL
ncbi:MAG TPA: protein kinase [Planctomycetota bacterium]|nr:protein kinase [Planctomycetota bacterium]